MNQRTSQIFHPTQLRRQAAGILFAATLGAGLMNSAMAEATPTKRIDRPVFARELGGQHLFSHRYPNGQGYQVYDQLHFGAAERVVELRWHGSYVLDFENVEGLREGGTPGTDTWVITFHSDASGNPGNAFRTITLAASEVPPTEIGLVAWEGSERSRYAFSHILEAPLEIQADTPFWVSVLSRSNSEGSVFILAPGSSGEVTATADAELAAVDHRNSSSRQVNLSTQNSGDGPGDRAFTLLTLPVEDADQDGMDDSWESENDLATGLDDSAGDPDGDGLSNLREFERGTDPQSADTDGDGLDDMVESGTGYYIDLDDRGTSPNHVDSDGDGLGDALEVPLDTSAGLSQPGTHPLKPDSDRDGLGDREEIVLGTHPMLIDSDGDSILDNWEILNGTDPTDPASPVAVVPAPLGNPVQTWNTLRTLPSFDNFRSGADRQDVSFSASIDFDAKPAGEREVIFETGGGRVGYSLAYEAGNKLVLRAIGNVGLSFALIEGVLRDQWIDAGEVEVVWSYDVSNSEGTQTIGLWVDGTPISEIRKDIGGDWSGNNGASFGIGGTRMAATGAGSVGISGTDFVSGTINLTRGLRYFPRVPEISSIQHPLPKMHSIRLNDSGEIILEWSSHPQGVYILEASGDLEEWSELDDDIQADGFTTTWNGAGTEGEELPLRSFYRVKELR